MINKEKIQDIISMMQWDLDECDDWRITMRQGADEIIMMLLKEEEDDQQK